MAKEKFSIAVCQFRSHITAFEQNIDMLISYCQQARAQGASVIVAPELCMGGYPAMDLWARKDFLREGRQALELLQTRMPEGIQLILGTVVDYSPNFYRESSQALSIAMVSSQGMEFVHAKSFLPFWGTFYEERYFSPIHEAEALSAYEVDGVRLGILYYEEFKYSLGDASFVAQLKEQHVDLVILITAAPYIDTETHQRIAFLKKQCAGLFPVIYVNAVGGQGELVFDGQSLFVDQNGNVKLAKAFENDFFVVQPFARAQQTSDEPLCEYELIYKALTSSIRDFVSSSHFTRVCLGLSGGIDSAVVATLAVQALGKENVIGILMPSRYSSEGSIADAQALADNLGITTHTIPIEEMHAVSLGVMGAHFATDGLVEENLQARLRAVILMAYSNSSGSLLLTTGNKSELAVGFSTLYGDSCGALGPIGDLWKTRVYALAHYMNERIGQEVIPKNTLEKPPSAELSPGQLDKHRLPDYALLDQILSLYIEKNYSIKELVDAGFSKEEVSQVLGLFEKSHYKRQQIAPVVHISERSFGLGYMWPFLS